MCAAIVAESPAADAVHGVLSTMATHGTLSGRSRFKHTVTVSARSDIWLANLPVLSHGRVSGRGRRKQGERKKIDDSQKTKKRANERRLSVSTGGDNFPKASHIFF